MDPSFGYVSAGKRSFKQLILEGRSKKQHLNGVCAYIFCSLCVILFTLLSLLGRVVF